MRFRDSQSLFISWSKGLLFLLWVLVESERVAFGVKIVRRECFVVFDIGVGTKGVWWWWWCSESGGATVEAMLRCCRAEGTLICWICSVQFLQ